MDIIKMYSESQEDLKRAGEDIVNLLIKILEE